MDDRKPLAEILKFVGAIIFACAISTLQLFGVLAFLHVTGLELDPQMVLHAVLFVTVFDLALRYGKTKV